MGEHRERIFPVILSGGAGTRLWPLSRTARPKQFLALAGSETLFARTIARVRDRRLFAPPLVVTNERHRFLVGEELRREGDTAGDNILLEPESRNTAPAVALAALFLCESGADPLLLVMPSDHAIADEAGFRRAVETGAEAAVAGRLVTFGIRPTRAETGYGYIAAGEALDRSPGCLRVLRFVEKPDRTTAEGYLAAGNFLWNSGIFLFRASRLLEELARHAPDILAACEAAMGQRAGDADFIRPDPAAFTASPSESIDYAVMEKSRHVAVVPAEFGWSDIGSWAAVWEQLDQDQDGNVTIGDVLVENCRNTLFWSDGPTIAAVGVENLVVVSSKDALLILPREQAQEVRKIVTRLEEEGRREKIDD